ncbi:hypothetical protein PHJA_001886800 [Phtheirospermum japonicum]|uniref:Uncharacterized protein n=1 Tax=Phtheirospermum japonicum TaxID=374723 RepID=A0A830C9K7_9LAMI|nr:hypothetical protein PHJA_001886800 [Phtheirospermum japonicum]
MSAIAVLLLTKMMISIVMDEIDTAPDSITHLKPLTKYLGSQYYQLFFCSSSGVSLSFLHFSSSLVTWEVSSPKHTAS